MTGSTRYDVVDRASGDVIATVTRVDAAGEAQPLTAEHGGPVRALIPHLYLWKSAKWLRRIDFRVGDTPGFWEMRGYHDRGDPWQEQRYSDDA